MLPELRGSSFLTEVIKEYLVCVSVYNGFWSLNFSDKYLTFSNIYSQSAFKFIQDKCKLNQFSCRVCLEKKLRLNLLGNEEYLF